MPSAQQDFVPEIGIIEVRIDNYTRIFNSLIGKTYELTKTSELAPI